jgi:hypothetical protein
VAAGLSREDAEHIANGRARRITMASIRNRVARLLAAGGWRGRVMSAADVARTLDPGAPAVSEPTEAQRER